MGPYQACRKSVLRIGMLKKVDIEIENMERDEGKMKKKAG